MFKAGIVNALLAVVPIADDAIAPMLDGFAAPDATVASPKAAAASYKRVKAFDKFSIGILLLYYFLLLKQFIIEYNISIVCTAKTLSIINGWHYIT